MTIQGVLQKFHSWEQVKEYSEGELNMLRACIEEVESCAESQCESVQEVPATEQERYKSVKIDIKLSKEQVEYIMQEVEKQLNRENDELAHGWICPICGRVLSPTTSTCPCSDRWEVTC